MAAFDVNVGLDFSFKANGDLSAKQFRFMVVASTGVVAAAGAASEAVVGVLQNDPTDQQAASVRTGGGTKIAAGGSFVVGDLLASDSNGKAVKYTKATVFTGTPYVVSGSNVLGVALEAGASGQTSSMLVSPRGFHS